MYIIWNKIRKWNPRGPGGEIGAWVGGRGRRGRRATWGIGGWDRGTPTRWPEVRRPESGTRERRQRGRRRWRRAQGWGSWGGGRRRRRRNATSETWECGLCGPHRWGEGGPPIWFWGRLWLMFEGIAGFRGTSFGILCNRWCWERVLICVSKKILLGDEESDRGAFLFGVCSVKWW